jgi:dTDP-4-dehydrorhamnose reductase
LTRILLTGGDGQLGRELLDCATNAGHTVRSTDRADCDVADSIRVGEVIDETDPEVLINCAAWTRVDDAETNADAAFRLNALGPRVLAAACDRKNVLLIHLSTDYVFAGDAGAPIDEWQQPRPRSVYGASKLAGEQEVRNLARRHIVVRTSWLYGRHGPNFVLTMLRAGEGQQPMRVVSDQVGSPTWTGHLAPALLRLMELDIPGTYHLSNAGAVSWYGFAQAIFAAVGDATEVTPIPTSEYPTPAPRPAYSVLDNRVWRLLGETPLPEWQEGLRAYLASLVDQRAPGA